MDIAIAVVILLVGGAIFVAYQASSQNPSNEHNRSKRFGLSNWQQFAQSEKQLKYVARDFWGNVQVTGSYRGYNIQLYTTSGDHTCLRIKTESFVDEQANSVAMPLHSAKDIVNLITPHTNYQLDGDEIEVRDLGQEIFYEQYDLETHLERLHSLLDGLCDLGDNFKYIISQGGKIAPQLEEIILPENYPDDYLRMTVGELLKAIAQRTKKKLANQGLQLICPQCLVHIATHEVKLLAPKSISYYGCRACSQSDRFIDGIDEVVAILDEEKTEKTIRQNNILYVNWITHRKVFDFDHLYILSATEEDIERFAMQLGNDTDEWRSNRYARMTCSISSKVVLSDNLVKILRRSFGNVETGQQIDFLSLQTEFSVV